MAFIEGWPHLRGGLYEGFHCIFMCSCPALFDAVLYTEFLLEHMKCLIVGCVCMCVCMCVCVCVGGGGGLCIYSTCNALVLVPFWFCAGR